MAAPRGTTGGKKPRPAGSGRQPVDSKTHARVLALGRLGTMSRNAIAREVGISSSTVSRFCAEAEPPILFDRSATKVATEAKVLDAKAHRALLSGSAITEVERLFGLLTAEHEVIHWDKDGIMHTGKIDRPTSGDIKNYATSIGILIDKHIVLTKLDSDDRDLPAVDAWLQHVMGRTA